MCESYSRTLFRNEAVSRDSTANPERFNQPAVFHPVALSSFLAFHSPLVLHGAIPRCQVQVSKFDILARFDRRETSQHNRGCRAKQNGDLYPGHFGSVLPKLATL